MQRSVAEMPTHIEKHIAVAPGAPATGKRAEDVQMCTTSHAELMERRSQHEAAQVRWSPRGRARACDAMWCRTASRVVGCKASGLEAAGRTRSGSSHVADCWTRPLWPCVRRIWADIARARHRERTRRPVSAGGWCADSPAAAAWPPPSAPSTRGSGRARVADASHPPLTSLPTDRRTPPTTLPTPPLPRPAPFSTL